jgi:hypothetical protein
MKIKLRDLYIFGFLIFVSSYFCLNFIFFSSSESQNFAINSNDNSNDYEIENYDEKTLELQMAEELSQLSPNELTQFFRSQM